MYKSSFIYIKSHMVSVYVKLVHIITYTNPFPLLICLSFKSNGVDGSSSNNCMYLLTRITKHLDWIRFFFKRASTGKKVKSTSMLPNTKPSERAIYIADVLYTGSNICVTHCRCVYWTELFINLWSLNRWSCMKTNYGGWSKKCPWIYLYT